MTISIRAEGAGLSCRKIPKISPSKYKPPKLVTQKALVERGMGGREKGRGISPSPSPPPFPFLRLPRRLLSLIPEENNGLLITY